MAEPEIRLAVSTVIVAVLPDDAARPRLHVPLVPRTRQPDLDRWALPGGWLPADEDLDAAAARTLREATGLTPSRLTQLHTFGAVDRSPTGRVVSVVYQALVRADEAAATAPGWNVRWFPIDALPELAFDHGAVLAAALERLRAEVAAPHVAQSLLGTEFTLADLRAVHEAVLGRSLDAANFRRWALASADLEDTGRTRTGTRHRPPRLYRHRPEGATP